MPEPISEGLIREVKDDDEIRRPALSFETPTEGRGEGGREADNS